MIKLHPIGFKFYIPKLNLFFGSGGGGGGGGRGRLFVSVRHFGAHI